MSTMCKVNFAIMFGLAHRGSRSVANKYYDGADEVDPRSLPGRDARHNTRLSCNLHVSTFPLI